jgi:predicted DsbA family dithiol-disulfide isomerase
MESVVEKNFRKLLGKAIRPSADSTSLIFAWEKNSLTATEGQTCEAYLQQLQSVAYTKTSLRKLNESHGNYRPNVNRIGKTFKVHMYNVTADDVLYEMAAETGVDMKK